VNSFGPLPFTLAAEFVPRVAFDGPEGAAALWFVFQDSKLIVWYDVSQCKLPSGAVLAELGLEPIRHQFLGSLGDTPCFAAEIASGFGLPPGASVLGLREVFGKLPEAYFALAGRAIQLVDWDRNHQFCGACATPTKLRETERARVCPNCALVSYPRIAPAVMVLIRREREILLARSPHFPPGMYSALAGFVDPGETLERTIEREVHEEVGLRVDNIAYFSSQPWPFPHSLMIAFTADYAGGEIVRDPVEIEDARWFGIDCLPRLPGEISISRRLIDTVVSLLRESLDRPPPKPNK
jgi:NAD+ diphosphatase